MAHLENKTIIFMETKKKVDDITKKLKNRGYASTFGLKRSNSFK